MAVATSVPTLTAAQRTTYEAIQKIRMMWVAQIFVGFWFSVFAIAFLIAVFYLHSAWHTSSVLGVIDGIIGWTFRHIIRHLHPTPPKA